MTHSPASRDILSTSSDPPRRNTPDLLRDRERSAAWLAQRFDVTFSAVSQHLRLLREAGLVRVRRSGRERWYQLNPAALEQVADWVTQYERFWQDKLARLDEHLRKNP
ncbi:MAG TPA: metalloregulator ArsR/SmtB family transcription factor [Gemmataceae bacterium]|nr:metalloregulator ArsR/SmtB family transcription factor [Gemmataceae bacterium]